MPTERHERIVKFREVRRQLRNVGFVVWADEKGEVFPEDIIPTAEEFNVFEALEELEEINQALIEHDMPPRKALARFRDMAEQIMTSRTAYDTFVVYCQKMGSPRINRTQYNEIVKEGVKKELEKALVSFGVPDRPTCAACGTTKDLNVCYCGGDCDNEVYICKSCDNGRGKNEILDEDLLCPECKASSQCQEHSMPVERVGPSGELWCKGCVNEALNSLEDALVKYIRLLSEGGDSRSRIVWDRKNTSFWADAGTITDPQDVMILSGKKPTLEEIAEKMEDLFGLTREQANDVLKEVHAKDPHRYAKIFPF